MDIFDEFFPTGSTPILKLGNSGNKEKQVGFLQRRSNLSSQMLLFGGFNVIGTNHTMNTLHRELDYYQPQFARKWLLFFPPRQWELELGMSFYII